MSDIVGEEHVQSHQTEEDSGGNAFVVVEETLREDRPTFCRAGVVSVGSRGMSIL